MKRELTEKQKEYIKFLCDERNILNCEECFHNDGNDDLYTNYASHPCGQHTCWVEVHCARQE